MPLFSIIIFSPATPFFGGAPQRLGPLVLDLKGRLHTAINWADFVS